MNNYLQTINKQVIKNIPGAQSTLVASVAISSPFPCHHHWGSMGAMEVVMVVLAVVIIQFSINKH